jgi:CRISPR-associated exonuclease Cas4
MVTATQLSSYLYCQRKLFLSTVLLVEEPPKQELVKGIIWHETYELINNAEEKIVCSIKNKNYQEILDIYRQQYSKLLRNAIIKQKSKLTEFNISMIDIFKDYWSSFEEEAKEHALNVVNFIEKHEVYGKELWEKLTPKILSEQYFKSVKLNLSGIIDVLEVHNVNNILLHVPVELKTGKYPDKGMWDGHKIQLAAYMLLLEDAGKSVGEAAIKYRGADKRILQMNTFLREEVLDLITKTSNVLTSSEPPNFIDNKNKCKNCQFKETCYNQEKIAELVATVSSKKLNKRS